MKTIRLDSDFLCLQDSCKWTSVCAQFSGDREQTSAEILKDVDNSEIQCKSIDEQTFIHPFKLTGKLIFN